MNKYDNLSDDELEGQREGLIKESWAIDKSYETTSRYFSGEDQKKLDYNKREIDMITREQMRRKRRNQARSYYNTTYRTGR